MGIRGEHDADKAADGARIPWHQLGTDPDYRFSLANERTFLAWIRTSLALMAAAVAVAQLVPVDLHGARAGLALLLAGIGLSISATAYTRWVANERAMRVESSLPRTPLLPVAGYGLTLVGIIVVLVVLFG